MKKDDNELMYGLTFIDDEESRIAGYLESDIPFYMHGPTGVGKSARVKEIDPNARVIYLRNATPELINGKTVTVPPSCDVNNDGMEDHKPSWLVELERVCEEDKEHIHIVFFDELSNAFPSIQGYVFNIMLMKEVNGIWKLPKNSRVIAAGNEVIDSIAANEIAKPLFSRLAHIYIKDDYEKWIKWASKKGLNPLVISFMALTKGEFLRTKYTGISPNADPRKWEMVSNVLNYSGNVNVLYSLIDKEIVDKFIKFVFYPMVSINNIIENDLWEECANYITNANDKNDNELYLFVANMSRCPITSIKECYEIILKLDNKFIDLFDMLWTKGDKERQELLNKIKLVHVKDKTKTK